MSRDAGSERLAHGVTVVDTGFQRPRFDAAYLLVHAGRAAFIDTGSNHSVRRLMEALAAHGLDAGAVQWVILTHVHLDHAGGAGLLLQQLPNAKLVVHPRGVRHLADPSQLMAGVRSVYGAGAVARDYGEPVPVPLQRMVPATDGLVLHLGTRALRFLDTPGHARHHVCVWDASSGGCFVGDTLGVSYQELRHAQAHYALPSTTPVQFDPVALPQSIGRLLALHPRVAYITHYGAVGDVRAQAQMVVAQTRSMVALVRAPGLGTGMPLRRALADLYFAEAGRRGVCMARPAFDAIVAGDVELNAQGLEAWVTASAAQ